MQAVGSEFRGYRVVYTADLMFHVEHLTLVKMFFNGCWEGSGGIMRLIGFRGRGGRRDEGVCTFRRESSGDLFHVEHPGIPLPFASKIHYDDGLSSSC